MGFTGASSVSSGSFQFLLTMADGQENSKDDREIRFSIDSFANDPSMFAIW